MVSTDRTKQTKQTHRHRHTNTDTHTDTHRHTHTHKHRQTRWSDFAAVWKAKVEGFVLGNLLGQTAVQHLFQHLLFALGLAGKLGTARNKTRSDNDQGKANENTKKRGGDTPVSPFLKESAPGTMPI